jgi:hypothetical protein
VGYLVNDFLGFDITRDDQHEINGGVLELLFLPRFLWFSFYIIPPKFLLVEGIAAAQDLNVGA